MRSVAYKNDNSVCLHFLVMSPIFFSFWFLEHTSTTVRNILLNMIIEQVNLSVACKNDNSACLHFLIMSPDPYFQFISGLCLNNHLKYFDDTL